MYQHKVLSTCYRFLLSQEDAEDTAQEVFIEVFKSIKNYRQEANLGTWIYRIAITKSLDELKKRRRKKRISSFGKLLGLDDVIPWVEDKNRHDKNFENQDQWEQLLKALNFLPDNQRIALTLSKVEDFSIAEIADIMQLSITAVDALIYRAKQKLRVVLVNWKD
jgi:RNA polymerase sigma-70 factor (ECF subfamily)